MDEKEKNKSKTNIKNWNGKERSERKNSQQNYGKKNSKFSVNHALPLNMNNYRAHDIQTLLQ